MLPLLFLESILMEVLSFQIFRQGNITSFHKTYQLLDRYTPVLAQRYPQPANLPLSIHFWTVLVATLQIRATSPVVNTFLPFAIYLLLHNSSVFILSQVKRQMLMPNRPKKCDYVYFFALLSGPSSSVCFLISIFLKENGHLHSFIARANPAISKSYESAKS